MIRACSCTPSLIHQTALVSVSESQKTLLHLLKKDWLRSRGDIVFVTMAAQRHLWRAELNYRNFRFQITVGKENIHIYIFLGSGYNCFACIFFSTINGSTWLNCGICHVIVLVTTNCKMNVFAYLCNLKLVIKEEPVGLFSPPLDM